MVRKGLGKGLDSLIPDFYNEDFDSNSPQSLEDMLKENDDDAVDDIENKQDTVEEVKDIKSTQDDIKNTESKQEDKEEIVADNDDKKDNSTSEGSGIVKEESPEEKTYEETQEGSESSENLSGDKSSEGSLQTSHELEIQQKHVEEVKKIVDKNPRITLWSSKSSAVFRYLRKTEPEFSISKEASVLIEEVVSKKYPEIWALFDEN